MQFLRLPGLCDCGCGGSPLRFARTDASAGGSSSRKVGVVVTSVVVGSLVLAAAAGYLIYKYRLRVSALVTHVNFVCDYTWSC